MPTFDLRHATVTLQDGTGGTPKTLDVKVGTGTLNYTESRNIEYIMNRGLLYEIRQGDDVPMDVKFDFIWQFIRAVTGSGTPTVEDALKQRGEASSWISSDTDVCRPYALDILILLDLQCSTQQRELITLVDFRYEKLDHDAKNSQVSCSGKCNVTQATDARMV